MEIDLAHYRTRGSMVFSGRPKGEGVRTELHLDKLEESGEHIVIKIPGDIISVNRSFFLGLFGKSVLKLGEVGFRDVFAFDCAEPVKDDIESGLQRALVQGNALTKNA